MTNPLEAILARVLRDPDDTAARLDAAALFDASDPPRAQHIRLGIEADREFIARLTAHPDGRDPPPLDTWAQAAAIAQEHASRWCEPLAHLYDPSVPQSAWQVDRGFIGSARVRADDLAEQADALARHPIESLQIARPHAGTVTLADVLAQPVVRRVTSLFLNELQLTSADYEALASCETLDRCELIVLPYGPIYDPDLERLASSQRLRNLMLVVRNEVRPDPGATAIGNRPARPAWKPTTGASGGFTRRSRSTATSRERRLASGAGCGPPVSSPR